MQKKPNKINSKEQKAAAGNWGKPRAHEHHVSVPTPKEETKHHGSKKYKKPGKKVFASFGDCPFCLKDLPHVVPEELNPWRKERVRFFSIRSFGGIRAKKCQCGARERHKACPGCHRDTWFLNGSYKHQVSYFGCGFTGIPLH